MVLIGVQVVFVLYHVLLLAIGTELVFLRVLRSLVLTGVAVYVWLVAWSRYRLRHPNMESSRT